MNSPGGAHRWWLVTKERGEPIGQSGPHCGHSTIADVAAPGSEEDESVHRPNIAPLDCPNPPTLARPLLSERGGEGSLT